MTAAVQPAGAFAARRVVVTAAFGRHGQAFVQIDNFGDLPALGAANDVANDHRTLKGGVTPHVPQ